MGYLLIWNPPITIDVESSIKEIPLLVSLCSKKCDCSLRTATVRLRRTDRCASQYAKKANRNNGAIDVTTVGGRIKKLRTDAGFTQEELTARLHLEGKSAISNYENNSRGVSAEMLTQLSRLFHVSADYILNGDTPDNLDSIVNEAIEILNNLKTDKAK